MTPIVRRYRPEDYESIASLYRQGDLYGGQFSEARDGESRLAERTAKDPDAILVAEVEGQVAGTISLIEDGRVAWLFRFAVPDGEASGPVRQALYDQASSILRDRGHSEVLVYAPEQRRFEELYSELGFCKGRDICLFLAGALKEAVLNKLTTSLFPSHMLYFRDEFREENPVQS